MLIEYHAKRCYLKFWPGNQKIVVEGSSVSEWELDKTRFPLWWKGIKGLEIYFLKADSYGIIALELREWLYLLTIYENEALTRCQVQFVIGNSFTS